MNSTEYNSSQLMVETINNLGFHVLEIYQESSNRYYLFSKLDPPTKGGIETIEYLEISGIEITKLITTIANHLGEGAIQTQLQNAVVLGFKKKWFGANTKWIAHFSNK